MCSSDLRQYRDEKNSQQGSAAKRTLWEALVAPADVDSTVYRMLELEMEAPGFVSGYYRHSKRQRTSGDQTGTGALH